MTSTIKAKGVGFKPGEPYTHRLSKILDEYPDGSQILREILQNSDDAKSRQQIFILDRNTYPKKSLFETDLTGDGVTNLKLDRYQGPALLSKNDTIFEERDFSSLLSLANSEKRDQFDKIGVMGVGFNSIYHITDSPSFITGNNYVILDPHEWYFEGGIKYDFVKDKLAESYPDQFAPFQISGSKELNKEFEGSLFRYPLRTANDVIVSEIAKKEYKPDDILDMFKKFYENESINCLLFLKYIEVIKFYEIKEGESEKTLLYTIELENADEIRIKRQLVVTQISPMMKSLDSGNYDKVSTLGTLFIANYRQQENQKESVDNKWIIFNWLGNLKDAEDSLRKKFEKSIKDYKFIPNVGIAMPLNNLKDIGRLFCFLPLPISMPFLGSVHGYFAVSTNRRTLWTAEDNEDLAFDAIASLKVFWNLHLFDVILPQAWVNFLIKLPYEYPNIKPNELYDFWPIIRNNSSGSTVKFCKELLLNVINNLGVDDEVFCGPSTSNPPGDMSNILPKISDTRIKIETKFRLLSLANGYLPEAYASSIVSEILRNIGFPVIEITPGIKSELSRSRHKDHLNYYSPQIIRKYLHQNRSRWQNLKRDEILKKFIDKEIPNRLWEILYEGAKGNWDLNIKILTKITVANLIKKNLKEYNINSDEIKSTVNREWIYLIWENFEARSYDLVEFESLHLLPTNHGTLRKVNTSEKCLWNSIDNELDNKIQPLIEKFGAVFIDKNFEKSSIHDWKNLSPYVFKLADVSSVLSCLCNSNSYPQNLNIDLSSQDALDMIEYLCAHLQLRNFHNSGNGNADLIKVIKNLPIFTEVGHEKFISLQNKNRNWYLLPKEIEDSYGKIIAPPEICFLNANTTSLQYIFEKVIKIKRLSEINYWKYWVFPYLCLQPLHILEVVVEKLFNRLETFNSELKDILKETTFVTTGTLEKFLKKEDSDQFILSRPIDLYNPENRKISDLFFEDEKVFPVGKFMSRKISLLKNLGLKIFLSTDDIRKRFDVINANREIAKIDNKPKLFDDLHLKSFKLVEYIDDSWDRLFIKSNLNHSIFPYLQSHDWIPTMEISKQKRFSKPQDCRDVKDKDLIGYIAPILYYEIKNDSFRKHLGWKGYVPVQRVISQLIACPQHSSDQNIYDICNKIYEYMNEAISSKDPQSQSEAFLLREELHDKPWILVKGRFYSSDKVVFDLPKDFGNKNTLIVELPHYYQPKKDMFLFMGIRQKVMIQDYINVIRDNFYTDESSILSLDKIFEVIEYIEQISKKLDDKTRLSGTLKGLLIPTTKGKLVDLNEIQYDDMGTRLSQEQKDEFLISHSSISLNTAQNIGMQMLTGKFMEDADDFIPEFYEQGESLTTRIKNIINNADDAGAQHFKLYIDERSFTKNSNSLLDREMNLWQGPALWIYNDAEFTEKDFESLLKLGSGSKSKDENKIGRFGIGFNCAFNFTDLPSFVSGEYIAFLDPHGQYLPSMGVPPRRPLGNRYNFLKSDFRNRFSDQSLPYLSIEGCDFQKKFNGTLFRIPLRTHKTISKSLISDKIFEPNHLQNMFGNIEGNKEILFLRNIKYCSVTVINPRMALMSSLLSMTGRSKEERPDYSSQLIWETKINNMSPDIMEMRKSNSYEQNIFSLGIEILRGDKKRIEYWLLSSGGSEEVKPEFKYFAEEKKVMPRGGVAALIAEEANQKTNYLPKIRGEMYSYLSLSMTNNLKVMLNGSFSLSSDRQNILNSDLMADNNDDITGKWNRYILFDILPILHAKLLEQIAIINFAQFKEFMDDPNQSEENFIAKMITRDWPIAFNEEFQTSGIYKRYGLTVIQKLYHRNFRIFWTEANEGEFLSFRESCFANPENSIISDVLIRENVPIVKLSKEQYDNIEELPKLKRGPITPNVISPQLICDTLRNNDNIWNSYKKFTSVTENKESNNNIQKTVFHILGFIKSNLKSFDMLDEVTLVPLLGGNVGTFGKQDYYLAKKEYRELFKKTGPTHFIAKLPEDLKVIFTEELKIYKLKAKSIIKLLKLELPNMYNVKEIDWDPHSKSYLNIDWIEKILSFFTVNDQFELSNFSMFPLLPMTKPSKNNASNKSYDELFKSLSPEDIKILKSYINENISAEVKKRRETLSILKDLPIWSAHSSDKFISANSGALLPKKLPYFSLPTDAYVFPPETEAGDMFSPEDDTDYETLFQIAKKTYTELDYVKEYLFPCSLQIIPDDKYVDLLKKVLLLKDPEIENYLKFYEVIPNKSLTALVKACTLYDYNVEKFRRIFGEKDVFLPPALQNDAIVLDALARMGFKRTINSDTFIECALEVESKFQKSNIIPLPVTKLLVRELLAYFYYDENLLSTFSQEHLETLQNIKFIPIELNIPEHYKIFATKTSDPESFNSLYLLKHKNLVWTQASMIERTLEPPENMIRRLGVLKPNLKVVIDHWRVVVKDITHTTNSYWRSPQGCNELKAILSEIYDTLNKFVENRTTNLEGIIKINEKLFLNGDDPFNPEHWVAGINLVFNVTESIGPNLHKVNKFLQGYKSLLKLAGAEELKNIKGSVPVPQHDQSKQLIKQMIDFFAEQEASKHHDVIFLVKEEKIYANRYVLSAAANHFKTLFCGQMNESVEFQRVEVRIDDIEPETFRILIRWLYGQPFDEAVLHNSKTYDLWTLIDLLKASDKYQIDPLKEFIEHTIAVKCEVGVSNVLEIQSWANECNAKQLKDYCNKYIAENQTLVLQKRLDIIDNAEDEDEINQEREMIGTFLLFE
ncbi:10025_t:CDS:10 [Diversispora eburnea]|uniref:10025_t:CDS:1 n=1 Tax=Diversispora eburnea TaxID=1213867 RepID=A0A9N8ZMX4_9GLOM|nr:10025_t:CDS:10 [Diversispora eburnea]